MLSTALTRHWGLEVGEHVLIQEGNGRQVWQALTATGDVLVKCGSAPPAGLVAMEQPARTGFAHVPTLRRTTEGSAYAVHDGWAIWVMDWVEGIEPADSPDTYRELGRIAGALGSVEGFTQPRAQTVHDVMVDLRTRLAPGPEYLRLVESLELLVGQPEALVHGEINLANARRTDGPIVVLDWDDLGMGVRWLEPGYPLIHVFLGEDLTLDRAAAAAYYDGFTGGTGFDAQEGELVFAAATLHALRYLPWGDSEARWRRLLHAQANKAELLDLPEWLMHAPLLGP